MIISYLPTGSASNLTLLLTLNGAIGETITITSDKINDTVTLDNSGVGNYMLYTAKNTDITFAGNISGFAKTVTASDNMNTTVNVMPDNAFYWYGNKCGYDWTNGAYYNFNNIGSATGLTFNTNSILCYHRGNGISVARIEETTMLPTSKATKVKYIVEQTYFTQGSYLAFDFFTNDSGTYTRRMVFTPPDGTVTKQTLTFDYNLSVDTCLQIRCQTDNTSTIYALWLE